MKIWIARHGQTRLNKNKLMQGLTDEPLNDRGREQARAVHEELKDIHFDAVYASPLGRSQETAMIISGAKRDELHIDKRIIEVNFGKYEQRHYFLMGPAMTAYWALPEVFPAPPTVETIESMVKRSRSFIEELKKQPYENVLIVCHGGIIRALCGVIENRPKGIKWRPKPKNTEYRFYEI